MFLSRVHRDAIVLVNNKFQAVIYDLDSSSNDQNQLNSHVDTSTFVNNHYRYDGLNNANQKVAGNELSLQPRAWGQVLQIVRTRIASQWNSTHVPVYFRFDHHVLRIRASQHGEKGWIWEPQSESNCIETRLGHEVVDVKPSPFMPDSEIVVTVSGDLMINPFQFRNKATPRDSYDPLAQDCLKISLKENKSLVSCCYNEHPKTFVLASESDLLCVDARASSPVQCLFGIPDDLNLGKFCILEKCQLPSHGILSIHEKALALWDTRYPAGFVSHIEIPMVGCPIGYDFNNNTVCLWSDRPGDVFAARLIDSAWCLSKYFEGNLQKQNGKNIDRIDVRLASSVAALDRAEDFDYNGSFDSEDDEQEFSQVQDFDDESYSYKKVLQGSENIFRAVYTKPPIFGGSIFPHAAVVGGFLDHQGSTLRTFHLGMNDPREFINYSLEL